MSGDPLRDADRRDDRQHRESLRCPVCKYCGYHIQTEQIIDLGDGEYACEDCINERSHNLGDWLVDREMDGGIWDGIL